METATYDPNGARVGSYPVITQPIVLLSGQNLAANAVLGRVTASGKYILSLSGASDGSQTPVAILAEAANADGADVTVPAYFTGEFDGAKLVYGTGHTAATVEASLRGRGQSLFIKTL